MAQLAGTATLAEIIASLQASEGINQKSDLAAVIGSPTQATDAVATQVNAIQTQKNNLAAFLTALGQAAAGTDALKALVDKVGLVPASLDDFADTATADLTIAVGDVLQFTNNGKVKPTGSATSATVGGTVLSTGVVVSYKFAATEGKTAMVVYYDGTASALKAVTLTINADGTGFTAGNPTALPAFAASGYNFASIGGGKFILVGMVSNVMKALILTAGATVAYGSVVTLFTGAGTVEPQFTLTKRDTDQAILVYKDGANLTGRVITVVDTTPTAQVATVLASSAVTGSGYFGHDNINPNDVFVSWRNTSDYGLLRKYKINADYTWTLKASAQRSAYSCVTKCGMQIVSETQGFFVYLYGGTNVQFFDYTDTTITLNATPYSTDVGQGLAYKISGDAILLERNYYDGTSTYYKSLYLFRRTGATMTQISAIQIAAHPSMTYEYLGPIPLLFEPSRGGLLMCCAPTSGTTTTMYLQGFFDNVDGSYNATKVDLPTPCGVALTAAAAGGVVTHKLKGIATGLSGLTPGTLYYCSTLGKLQTTANAYLVGIALSATELLLLFPGYRGVNDIKRTYAGTATNGKVVMLKSDGTIADYDGSFPPIGLYDGSKVTLKGYCGGCTGLTPGPMYFNKYGKVSNDATGFYLGLAISPTEILIQDYIVR